MSEPAKKCENNAAILSKIKQNCFELLKWPILVSIF